MMKPQAIFVVTLAVLAVIAALAPLGEAHPGSSWPCCNNCGTCNRKQPPDCKCTDVSADGCHPECKNCTRIGGSINPRFGLGPVVTYRCDDILTNFCQNNCTAA